jgi:hypothetical protein
MPAAPRVRVAAARPAAARVGRAYSASGFQRRPRFTSPRRRFDSSRRRFDAVVGRVAVRGRRTSSACASRSAKRLSASSRFRACDLVSCADAVTRGPSRAVTRAFCASLSASDAATSNVASTREAVTLACWPPGPDDRLTRSSISVNGTSRPGRTYK